MNHVGNDFKSLFFMTNPIPKVDWKLMTTMYQLMATMYQINDYYVSIDYYVLIWIPNGQSVPNDQRCLNKLEN